MASEAMAGNRQRRVQNSPFLKESDPGKTPLGVKDWEDFKRRTTGTCGDIAAILGNPAGGKQYVPDWH